MFEEYKNYFEQFGDLLKSEVELYRKKHPTNPHQKNHPDQDRLAALENIAKEAFDKAQNPPSQISASRLQIQATQLLSKVRGVFITPSNNAAKFSGGNNSSARSLNEVIEEFEEAQKKTLDLIIDELGNSAVQPNQPQSKTSDANEEVNKLRAQLAELERQTLKMENNNLKALLEEKTNTFHAQQQQIALHEALTKANEKMIEAKEEVIKLKSNEVDKMVVYQSQNASANPLQQMLQLLFTASPQIAQAFTSNLIQQQQLGNGTAAPSMLLNGGTHENGVKNETPSSSVSQSALFTKNKFEPLPYKIQQRPDGPEGRKWAEQNPIPNDIWKAKQFLSDAKHYIASELAEVFRVPRDEESKLQIGRALSIIVENYKEPVLENWCKARPFVEKTLRENFPALLDNLDSAPHKYSDVCPEVSEADACAYISGLYSKGHFLPKDNVKMEEFAKRQGQQTTPANTR